MRHLAPLVVCLLAACAHVSPRIDPATEHEYYTCRARSIEDAEASIVEAGLPIAQHGKGWAQTSYTQLREFAYASFLSAYEDRVTVSYRVDARQLGDDVAWSAHEMVAEQANRGILASNTQTTEHPFGPLHEDLVRGNDTRRVLNLLRRAVCGGEDFFQAPPTE